MKNIYLILITILVHYSNNAQSQNPKLDQIVNQYIKPSESGGVLLYAIGDNIIHHKAYGLSSKELNIPMQTKNVFRIASMTKQFVAVSILTLVEQGKLSLEDDIQKYVADVFPAKPFLIKIKNLLSHTSGIKNLTSIGNYQAFMTKSVTPAELIAYFKNEPLDFEPGTQHSYSNSGYILLHYIIEKISGMKLNDYMQKYLFSKINVTFAKVEADFDIIPNKATGYINEKMTADYMSMTQIACLVMSAQDMYRWHRGLYAGKIISKEHLKMAQSPFQLNDGSFCTYGFGWGMSILNGNSLIEHGGGISGYGGYEVYFPKEDIFCVFLANSQSRSEGLILYKAITAISKSQLLKDIKIDTKLMQSIKGNYTFGQLLIEISEKNGRLFFNGRYNTSSWTMRFTGNDSFYVEEQYPFEYTIIKDSSGKIIEIVAKGRGEYYEHFLRK